MAPGTWDFGRNVLGLFRASARPLSALEALGLFWALEAFWVVGGSLRPSGGLLRRSGGLLDPSEALAAS